jgi:hypothetical protein
VLLPPLPLLAISEIALDELLRLKFVVVGCAVQVRTGAGGGGSLVSRRGVLTVSFSVLEVIAVGVVAIVIVHDWYTNIKKTKNKKQNKTKRNKKVIE